MKCYLLESLYHFLAYVYKSFVVVHNHNFTTGTMALVHKPVAFSSIRRGLRKGSAAFLLLMRVQKKKGIKEEKDKEGLGLDLRCDWTGGSVAFMAWHRTSG